MDHPTEKIVASLVLNKLHETQPDLRQKIEDAHIQLTGVAFSEAATGPTVIVAQPGTGQTETVSRVLKDVSDALDLSFASSRDIDDETPESLSNAIVFLPREAGDSDRYLPRGLPSVVNNLYQERASKIKNAVLFLDMVSFEESEVGRGQLHGEFAQETASNQFKLASISTAASFDSVLNSILNDAEKLGVPFERRVQVVEYTVDPLSFVERMRMTYADTMKNPEFAGILQGMEDAGDNLFTAPDGRFGPFASPRSYQKFLSEVQRIIYRNGGTVDKLGTTQLAHSLLGAEGAEIATAHLSRRPGNFLDAVNTRREQEDLGETKPGIRVRTSFP